MISSGNAAAVPVNARHAAQASAVFLFDFILFLSFNQIRLDAVIFLSYMVFLK